MSRLPVAVLVVFACLCTSAQAATTVTQLDTKLMATADDGANTITLTGQDAVTIAETGSTVTLPLPVAGCSGDGTTVTCTVGTRSLIVDGGKGDDTITDDLTGSAYTGITINGGDGNDTLRGPSALRQDLVNGNAGDDTLIARESPSFSDALTPDAKFDGGDGNDTLKTEGDGAFGGDTGGAGDDTFASGVHYSQWSAEPGADTYQGAGGISYATAAGPVTVTADGVANDGLAGEHDNVPPTISEIDGGPGDDTLDASAATARVSLDGNAGNDTLTGSAFDDSLYGGAGDDTLLGGGGNDALSGEDGADRIDGGAGDDRIAIGTGAEDIHGGAGSDTLQSIPFQLPCFCAPPGSELRARTLTVSLDDVANDGLGAQRTANVHSDVETLVGGDGADTLTGGPGTNILDGGLGDDTFNTVDGAVDDIRCGGGEDSAHVDPIDTTTDCEHVASSTAKPVDHRAPRFTRIRVTRFSNRLKVVLDADEAVRATLRVGTRSSKATRLAKRQVLSLPLRTKAKLTVRLTITDAAGNATNSRRVVARRR